MTDLPDDTLRFFRELEKAGLPAWSGEPGELSMTSIRLSTADQGGPPETPTA